MRFDMRSNRAGEQGRSWRSRHFGPTTRIVVRAVGIGAVALLAANCSQQKMGRMIDPKLGVAPSPRVVADGQPVPKGGGRAIVGKPYTVAGRTYVPSANPNYAAEGTASWYGSAFHGRLTANGEIFDRDSIAAAHTTMPLPSYARVTNVRNGRSIIVRVNDRGPVGPASVHGSDDRILLASLRTDGRPAVIPGAAPTMIASKPAPAARETVALRSVAPPPAAGSRALPARTLAYASARPAASATPFPPERPFDLGTIPFAATPISMIGPAYGPRPVVAGL
jgi:rare lipoprotein A